jgi:hypothetical protein
MRQYCVVYLVFTEVLYRKSTMARQVAHRTEQFTLPGSESLRKF